SRRVPFFSTANPRAGRRDLLAGRLRNDELLALNPRAPRRCPLLQPSSARKWSYTTSARTPGPFRCLSIEGAEWDVLDWLAGAQLFEAADRFSGDARRASTRAALLVPRGERLRTGLPRGR